MSQKITAKDIMSRKLITLKPEMRPKDAARILIKKNIRGAPVLDDKGHYLGVFSQQNCMAALVDAIHDQLPTTPSVKAYMDTETPTITEHTGFLTIVQLFEEASIHRLPVLRERKIVGQVSRHDVLSSVLRQIYPLPSHEAQLLYLSAIKPIDDESISRRTRG